MRTSRPKCQWKINNISLVTGAPQLAASQKRPWRPWILVVQTAAAEPHEASAALKLWTVLWTGKVWEHGIMPFCGSREESNPIYCWERWTNLRVHIKLVEDAEGRTRSANWGRLRPGSFAYPVRGRIWLQVVIPEKNCLRGRRGPIKEPPSRHLVLYAIRPTAVQSLASLFLKSSCLLLEQPLNVVVQYVVCGALQTRSQIYTWMQKRCGREVCPRPRTRTHHMW